MTINPYGNIYIMCFDINVVLKVYKSACEWNTSLQQQPKACELYNVFPADNHNAHLEYILTRCCFLRPGNNHTMDNIVNEGQRLPNQRDNTLRIGTSERDTSELLLYYNTNLTNASRACSLYLRIAPTEHNNYRGG